MDQSSRDQKARQIWIKTYQQLGSVSKAARRCGIPRSTLYRWLKRYKEYPDDNLSNRSRRPHKLAKQVVNEELEKLVLQIREGFKFGQRRIRMHLLRHHKVNLSAATIWRILKKHQVKALKKFRKPEDYKRYSRPVPGDRIQVDVTKIAPGCYQFTAIDDCTRLRVLRLYPRKTAQYAIEFFLELIDSLPFTMQRIQTDWGTEFFNDAFQEELMEHFVKYRPIKPRSPHLNGKVERSQQTHKAEFYSQFTRKELKLEVLKPKLSEWEYFYNHQRPHESLKGKTPYERFDELQAVLPFDGDIRKTYWEKQEEILPRNHQYLQFRKKQKVSHIS